MGKPWWSLVTALGTFLGFFEALGGYFGHPWAPFWRPWDTLEHHFGGFGTPLGSPWPQNRKRHRKLSLCTPPGMPQGCPKDAPRCKNAAKMAPQMVKKCHPKAARNRTQPENLYFSKMSFPP